MYEALGFTKNPFFTDPLGANEEDFEKFIGRTRDVHSYLAQITGREGCVHLVTGNPGVGKTSFVNIMQYVTCFGEPTKHFKDIKHTPTLLISNTQKLQINSDETSQSLMLKITSSIIYSLMAAYDKRKKPLPSEIERQHKRINEFITSTTSPSTGIQLGPVGGSYGGQATGYEGTSSVTISHLTRAVQEMTDKSLADLNMNGLYVVINNLDIVEIDRLVKILNELRDELFSIKALWIILLGSKGT